MRFLQLGWVDFVVLGDRAVNAKYYRSRLARQVRDAKRALPALDL